MSKNIYIPFLIILLSVQSLWAQQDPLYNLYSFNQYMVNPAYAGIYDNFTANLITRKQWAGVNGSPLTNLFTAQTSVGYQFGTGIQVVNDRLGINNNTEVQASFSYKITSNEKTLSFGMQGGFINYQYDYNKLNLAFDDDEGLDMSNDNLSKSNFGVGVFYKTDKYYLGISVPRILNVKVNEAVGNSTRYLPHYYLSGGLVIKPKSMSSFVVKPSFLVRYTENQVAADISVNALFDRTIWAGLTLRNLNALAVNTQVQVNKSFRFGYSFGLPTNKLVRGNFGTHEVSLLVELNLLKDHFDTEKYF